MDHELVFDERLGEWDENIFRIYADSTGPGACRFSFGDSEYGGGRSSMEISASPDTGRISDITCVQVSEIHTALPGGSQLPGYGGLTEYDELEAAFLSGRQPFSDFQLYLLDNELDIVFADRPDHLREPAFYYLNGAFQYYYDIDGILLYIKVFDLSDREIALLSQYVRGGSRWFPG